MSKLNNLVLRKYLDDHYMKSTEMYCQCCGRKLTKPVIIDGYMVGRECKNHPIGTCRKRVLSDVPIYYG